MIESDDRSGRAGEVSTGSAAFFDVDGTLLSTNIVDQYVRIRTILFEAQGGASGWRHRAWLGWFYLTCLRYLLLDRIGRARMNIVFYRRYAGLPVEAVRAAAKRCVDELLCPNVFRGAIECIAEHGKAGRRIVLVTGSVDFVMQPLADRLAGQAGCGAGVGVIARSLVARDGRFTGALDGVPLAGDEKAKELATYARRHGLALSECFAYGDSVADLPMLEAVGHPVAVNADARLRRIAAARRWETACWDARVGRA